MVSAIDVGTASVNWGFDPLYTWVRKPPFSRMLDEMTQAGYSGTEISYNFPTDVSELRDELSRRSLRAAATFHALDLRDAGKHDEALRDIGPIADRLQALGSDVLILSDQPCAARLAVAGRVAADGSDGLDEREWQAMGHGLNRAGEELAVRGMHAVFHPHVGTYVETRAEIDRLCAKTDPALIGLCPDTGHLAYAGVSPRTSSAITPPASATSTSKTSTARSWPACAMSASTSCGPSRWASSSSSARASLRYVASSRRSSGLRTAVGSSSNKMHHATRSAQPRETGTT